jgi:hypothetical protein
MSDRDSINHEDNATFVSEVCIRVFEAVMNAVADHETMGQHYSDLFQLYTAVLRDELKEHAFTLAYTLYAEDPVVKQRRRELSRRRND